MDKVRLAILGLEPEMFPHDETLVSSEREVYHFPPRTNGTQVLVQIGRAFSLHQGPGKHQRRKLPATYF